MGVPAFFRWLSQKYPAIVVQSEDFTQSQNYHFDNLYLDMNGIIHPCTHPENKPPPENEQEMFLAIYDYIEMLMKIVRPKKLLYMAVDGVAPRAKMNQQRSRRFRASQESIEKKIEIQRIKDDLRNNGIVVEENPKQEHFDSNVITPGTQFMINLSIALRAWIDSKLSSDYPDPDGIWPKDLVVVLSDASVPGEGEHKLIEFIRKQKAHPDYNPDLSHCLCGADADLIHLGLATHELNFTILREEFVPNQPRPCEICNQFGHEMKECQGKARDPDEPPKAVSDPGFIFIRLNVLREYLEKEAEGIDLERFIDDWVCLCFFVGNDFLPHLPSLEIREGAIDRLIRIYKSTMGSGSIDYLTESGKINLERVQMVLQQLGEHEDNIFKQRKVSEAKFKAKRKRQKFFKNRGQNMNSPWHRPDAVNQAPSRLGNIREEATKSRVEGYNNVQAQGGRNVSAAQNLKAMLRGSDFPSQSNDQESRGVKRKEPEPDDSDPDDLVDLGEEGWKARYYYQKFDCVSYMELSRQVAREYVIGLCWVLRYYYQGCCDWQWFYPYHYAPFASDFVDIAAIDVQFNLESRPFKPLEQLMSVFPAASCENLPPTWRKLMTEKSSPIVDFYPNTFKIDLNGKTAAWMGVALLPFIDEDRLKEALATVYDDLNEDEKERNSLGNHLVFVSNGSDAQEFIKGCISKNETLMEGTYFGGINGYIKESSYNKDLKGTSCVAFTDPKYPLGFMFPALRLQNAKVPDKVLRPGDFVGEFRPTIGMSQNSRGAYMGQSGHRMMNNALSSAHGGHHAQGGSYNQPQYGQADYGNRYGNQQTGKRNIGYANNNYQQKIFLFY